jgi:hypothetical protein
VAWPLPSPRKSRREGTGHAAYRDALDKGVASILSRASTTAAAPFPHVVGAASDDFTAAHFASGVPQASLVVARSSRCPHPAEHISLAECMDETGDSRAVGLRARLIGQPLGHDVAIVKKLRDIRLLFELLAEREGFEPPIRLPVCRISSAVHSTALPPLRSRKQPEKAAFGRPLSNQARQERQETDKGRATYIERLGKGAGRRPAKRCPTR